jgi:N,N'-diacetyllegionaminate synthase
MLKKLELSEEMHRTLIDHCKLRDISFLSTGFDIQSIDFLRSLGQEIYKIPSGEINNLPYLRHIGRLGKKVILSTGMSSLMDIESALNVLVSAGTAIDDITILHCTSEYPAPIRTYQ